MSQVKWPERAVLLSFWKFAAWYLYVGGLVVQGLSFLETLVAILIANLTFVAIFVFYAGAKKGKDVLFQEAFGSGGAKYFISFLPVLSQIGWYAVVIEIGGTALALALGFEKGSMLLRATIVIYAFITIWIARGGLKRIGKLSYASIPAMAVFSLWAVYAVFNKLGFEDLFSYQPLADNSRGLLYGIQLVTASFISAAVTIPDFLHDLRSKKEVFLASFWGLVPTTLWVGGLGAALAIIGGDYDVLVTLQIMSGPLFVYMLLSVDNLCGAQAIFPVGTGLASTYKNCQDEHLNEKRRKTWTLIGGVVSIILAEIGIVDRLEMWLTILGTVFAPIIGIVLANQYIIKRSFFGKSVHWPAFIAWAVGLATSFVSIGIPIIQALLASFITFIVIKKLTK